MKAAIKFLFVLIRPFTRIAVSLEKIATLYELECRDKGLFLPMKNSVKDDAQVMYGSEKADPKEEED
jgi:hypothetical protein